MTYIENVSLFDGLIIIKYVDEKEMIVINYGKKKDDQIILLFIIL